MIAGTHDIVIPDTSCLIVLSKIGELRILERSYRQVIIPEEVALEFGSSLPEWLEVRVPSIHSTRFYAGLELDPGEKAAFALCKEIENALLILDDLDARKYAEHLNISYTGTLGVILRSKRLGVIETIAPILEKIQGTNFRLTNQLLEEVLAKAGESQT